MVYAVKDFEPTLRTMKDYVIDFGMSLESDNQTIPETHNVNTFKVLTSNVFVFKGMDCSIEDDSNGNVRIVKQEGDFIVTVQNIGTIDYDTGIVKLTNFAPDRLKIGNAISLSASVRESDITSQRRTILDIRDTDITVNVEQVRL
jgi:hypothetical protein